MAFWAIPLALVGGVSLGCQGQEGDLPPGESTSQAAVAAEAVATSAGGIASEAVTASEPALAPPEAPAALPRAAARDRRPVKPPAFTEYLLPSAGGSGGTYTPHAGNGIIYGVVVHSGQYVDSVAFDYYQPRRADNYYSPGDVFKRTARFGGSGGYFNYLGCPAGQGVIAIQGRSGTLIDAVGITCSDVNHPSPYNSSNWSSAVLGGAGGYPFDDTCAGDFFVDGFNVRWAQFVISLQTICVPAH